MSPWLARVSTETSRRYSVGLLSNFPCHLISSSVLDRAVLTPACLIANAMHPKHHLREYLTYRFYKQNKEYIYFSLSINVYISSISANSSLFRISRLVFYLFMVHKHPPRRLVSGLGRRGIPSMTIKPSPLLSPPRPRPMSKCYMRNFSA